MTPAFFVASGRCPLRERKGTGALRHDPIIPQIPLKCKNPRFQPTSVNFFLEILIQNGQILTQKLLTKLTFRAII